jgi:hypothetical protein
MAAHRPVLITNYSPNFNRLTRLPKSRPMGQVYFLAGIGGGKLSD